MSCAGLACFVDHSRKNLFITLCARSTVAAYVRIHIECVVEFASKLVVAAVWHIQHLDTCFVSISNVEICTHSDITLTTITKTHILARRGVQTGLLDMLSDDMDDFHIYVA